MIDLEHAFSALIERAPAPPDIARVGRRAAQRHSRRRLLALAATVAVVGAGIGSAAAVDSSRSTGRPRPPVASAPGRDIVRVTLLDGSRLSISGPSALGLPDLAPSFNAELVFSSSQSPWASSTGHSFTVARTAPAEPGAVVATYPTADGHELVVHATPIGVDATADYGDWTLVVHWNHDPTDWVTFAAALDAKETADGFLVIEPVTGWTLGPTDAPDVQLGSSFSFFGPATYPEGCPTAADPQPQWRCDAAARVRIGAVDPNLAPALAEVQVSYADPAHETDSVTTLDGSSSGRSPRL